jgi:hypothetical protein
MKKLPAQAPMKATCAIRELLSVPETERLALENYARLFANLIVRMTATAGIDSGKGPSPVVDAIDAFKEFLTSTKSSFIFETLDEREQWKLLETEESNTKAISSIAEVG